MDAAHVGPLEHEVFQKPFKVEPEYEMRRTPESYRRYPNGVDLPDEMQVWAVENSDSGKTRYGALARSLGYNDSPDAEALVVGYNDGKQYGSVGVGRHANFLQWGYRGRPSDMTDAGKKLFINCMVYISRFDGKAPLVRVKTRDRNTAAVLAMARNYVRDEEYFKEIFPGCVLERYKEDWKGMMGYYQKNLELVYQEEGLFMVDRDLAELGIQSNRKLETLAQLIAIFDEAENGAAARALLWRYTNESFTEKRQWEKWLAESKDRIYFSDVGGYKFLVVPKGYLDN